MKDYKELTRLLDIKKVATDYGLQVNRSGFANCPFHQEETPSLKLYRDSFFCFGCGAGGDTISLVAGIEGISQSEAFDELNSRYGIGLSEAKAVKRKKVSPQHEQWKKDALDAVAWYCRLCWQILYRTEGVPPEIRSFFQEQSQAAEELHQTLLETKAVDAYKKYRIEVSMYETLREEHNRRYS